MRLFSSSAALLLAASLAIVVVEVESRRLGCFVDKGHGRDMPLFVHSRGRTTRHHCLNYCKTRGYKYFGLQAGDWCFCGNSYGRYGRSRDSDCSRRCMGDRRQTCGGAWRNEIFTTNIRPTDGIRKGCYVDKGSKRDLPIALRARSRTTKAFCISFCRSRGYKYAGLQAGDWCMCGNSYGRYGKASDSQCRSPCHGDRSRTCGGGWRNEVFTTGAQGVRTLTNRIGCYVDKSSRDMAVAFRARSKTQRNFCINYCKARGYMYAGLQAGDWCTCGNKYGKYGKAKDAECYRQCHGNPKQTCGGNWRNEIFRTGIKKSDGIRLGCFKDKSKRDLPLSVKAGTRTTKQYCVNYCKSRNYKYASTQAGDWCHCGNSFGRYGRVKDSECHRKCWGDRSKTCGGEWRNEVFTTGVVVYKYEYKGCFADNSEHPDLVLHAGTSNNMRLGKCRRLCKRAGNDYMYFSVKNGRKCFCGVQYGAYGIADAKRCNVRCRGSRQRCGGKGFNSVYTVD